VSSLVSRFPLLVLLGLGLGLHPAANGVKMEAGCTTVQCDVVVGAALVTLAHPIDPASSFPILRRTDLGAGHAVQQGGRARTFPDSASPIISSRSGRAACRCCLPPGVSAGGSGDGLALLANKLPPSLL
jgi:hypothetical protein